MSEHPAHEHLADADGTGVRQLVEDGSPVADEREERTSAHDHAVIDLAARATARGSALREVLVALADGRALADHENPGEATLHVLRGRVSLSGGDQSTVVAAGQLAPIPPVRHRLDALEDAVVMLTIVPRDRIA